MCYLLERHNMLVAVVFLLFKCATPRPDSQMADSEVLLFYLSWYVFFVSFHILILLYTMIFCIVLVLEFRNETESLNEFTKRDLSSFQLSNEKCGSISPMLPVPFVNLVCINLAFNKVIRFVFWPSYTVTKHNVLFIMSPDKSLINVWHWLAAMTFMICTVLDIDHDILFNYVIIVSQKSVIVVQYVYGAI